MCYILISFLALYTALFVVLIVTSVYASWVDDMDSKQQPYE